MASGKTAIILMNMGGPDSLDDVEPFLYNLFMDPDIIGIPFGQLFRPFIARKISKKRASKVRSYYEKIGGGSPLLKLTLEQAGALQAALKDEGDFSTHVAMRYWHPFTDEAIENALRENPSRIVLFPLYPQFSMTTTGSGLNEFRRIWNSLGRNDIAVTAIKNWHNNEKYINTWVETIREALKEFNGVKPHVIFSAHGIPQKLVERGDPYQGQTEESVELILKGLKWNGPWHISYQSRVGPVRWLAPATDRLLVELGEKGVEGVLMVPISFVSDHSETLYEMDIQYRELAKEAGIKLFKRAPSLNSNPYFIEALKDIVLENVKCQSSNFK